MNTCPKKVAALLQLTADEVLQRLTDLADEEQVLRHVLRALREREKLNSIRARMQQGGQR